MKLHINPRRLVGERDPMLYGHFIEHFHRQIYGGLYDPGNPLSDEEGFREDVLEALRKIGTPILRWPGGCFVSSYHWKEGVGPDRQPSFDKAWRVEDPNSFGTDEYARLCEKLGCAPYICTNAGTGTAEEMSDWVEYCNLESEGRYARMRIANGHKKPHAVKYWSIGNENYGGWEIGAKSSDEWGRLVLESAKMMKHVDPTIELSAAALNDLDWNINLLRHCAEHLDWISIHQYWDALHQVNDPATYEECMAYTENLGGSIDAVRGLLVAMGLDKRIKIAFDEWNLRGWHHPNVHSVQQGITKEEFLLPRDENDDNSCYTMADAVFSACFLNTLLRNCDIVGMANFAPVVNTRGCVYAHEKGIVLRSTYHVFDLYVNYLGDRVVDGWAEEAPQLSCARKGGGSALVEAVDCVVTQHSDTGHVSVAAVNKSPAESHTLRIAFDGDFHPTRWRLCGVAGSGVDAYNDVGRDEVRLEEGPWQAYSPDAAIALPPHSAQAIQFE